MTSTFKAYSVRTSTVVAIAIALALGAAGPGAADAQSASANGVTAEQAAPPIAVEPVAESMASTDVTEEALEGSEPPEALARVERDAESDTLTGEFSGASMDDVAAALLSVGVEVKPHASWYAHEFNRSFAAVTLLEAANDLFGKNYILVSAPADDDDALDMVRLMTFDPATLPTPAASGSEARYIASLEAMVIERRDDVNTAAELEDALLDGPDAVRDAALGLIEDHDIDVDSSVLRDIAEGDKSSKLRRRALARVADARDTVLARETLRDAARNDPDQGIRDFANSSADLLESELSWRQRGDFWSFRTGRTRSEDDEAQ